MKLIKIVTPVVLLGLTQFTFADGNFKRFLYLRVGCM